MSTPSDAPAGPPAPPGFFALLHRSLFFAWLFRDASRGGVHARRAAWRHNQGCARWLPVYMRRHLVLGLMLFCLGLGVEEGLGLAALSALFYVPSVLTVPYNVVAGVAWLGLRWLPPPA